MAVARGFDKPRLERLRRVMADHVERGELSGLVALVARGGEVHVEALGTLGFGDPRPMRRDTIFRVASITKPVTAAAAMVLVEECRLRLDDPIDPWVPEMADRRVLRSIESPLDDTVPARRSITLRDLLTSCMGLGSVMAMPDTYPIQGPIRELRIGGDGPRVQTDWPTTDEWVRNLGSLPLIHQPGERWMYNVSFDLLGVVVERASGQPLGAFMRERIFEPLGMKDTGFRVPPDELDRLPTCYVLDHARNELAVWDPGGAESAWAAEPPFQPGAGGLVSTVDDYLAFSRMLLEKGGPVLSRASIDLMTSDQVTPEQRAGAEIFFGGHGSWGFGMGVDLRRTEIYQTPGRFGWDGGFGTSAYADPAEGMIGILMTQRLVDSPEAGRRYTDFWTSAYAAME